MTESYSTCYSTCLVIDDSYIDNLVTRRLLEITNFADNIILTESPNEAIESLRNGTVVPDVIFLDIRMPIMDGFEFMQEFEKLDISKKNIKIYLLSSSLDPADIQRSSDNEFITQLIHKPLTKQILEGIAL
jgi:response regulator RpfG family c-di-GMP phosphodiesterase